MTVVRNIAGIICIYLSLQSCAIAAVDDALRIVTALDLKGQVLARESNPNTRACVEAQWPTASKRLGATLHASFSPSDLRSLAHFFDSPSGRKWNARSAAQTKNADPRYLPVPIPEYAPGERETVNDFVASPLGQNYLRGPGGTQFANTVMSIFVSFGKDCYGK